MEITEFDVSVTVIMTLAVVAMSFVFPSLGLTASDTSENDIPELDVDENRFDVAEERPPFPNTATEGTLFYNTTRDVAFSTTELWLEGSDTSSGVQITLVQNVTDDNPKVSLLVWGSGSLTAQDNATLDSVNESAVLNAGDYTVAFETTEDNNPPDYLEVKWDISKQATTDSWIGRIPGVGALFSTVDLVAQVLAWAVTVFIWFATSLVFGAVNLVGIIVDVAVYLISLLLWLSTTYSTIVTNAPGWTSVFVAIPGIVLTMTLTKFVVVVFRSLPTT